MKPFLLSALVLAACLPSARAVDLATSYSEDFDTMGTGTAAPTGWTVSTISGAASDWTDSGGIIASAVGGGTANATLIATTTFGTTTSSSTAGFNFALSTSATDRALGTSPTGLKGTVLQLSLTNTSGGPLTDVSIGYAIRRFRVASSPGNHELPGYWLFYSVNNGATWTNVSALNPKASGATVNVPDSVGVTTVPSTAITFSSAVANNATVLLRWVDDNAQVSSPDHIVGLDNVAITVTAPNVPPTVTLTSPTASYSGTAPATVPLAATANDSDGSIAKVEFFNGATEVGEDMTAPYEATWNGVAAGTHTLTAIATDNVGATTTSASVTITVSPNPNQPPAVTLTAPADNATGIGSSITLTAGIADPEGDATTVTFYGRKTTPATPGPDFTIATLPDTQFYSQNVNGRSAIFYSQTQWLADNRDTLNIAFVSHMGDIVQNGDFNGNPVEWNIADTAMRKIEDQAATARAFGIPWGGAPGNHDQSPIGDAGGTTTFFNQYFGFARFAGRTYFGGHYGTTNDNNYQLFSASGLDFVIIHLEYDARAVSNYQAVLDWADEVLKAFPNRRAIVTSHWIVNTGNPATFSTQGQNIYNELKDNPNLFLLLCGHVAGEGQRSDVFQGRTVYSVLQDYQGRANGGDGWLRYFVFSPANNTITAKTYSTTLGLSETDANSEFMLQYNMQSSLTEWIPLGAVNVPAGGTTASLDWTGLEAGSRYEWHAVVSDGINTVTSATRRFSTAPPVPPAVTLTAPANNSSYAAPATIPLAADASDTDGTVTRVEFWQGSTKLGEDTSAPYSFSWSGMAPGSYSLTAVAVDNSGQASVSSPVPVTITGNTQVSSTLIPRGAVWKYLDDGTDQGTGWKEPAFAESWTSGAAKLGYGDAPVTALRQGPDGQVSATKFITYYFRRAFTVADPAAIQSIAANLLRDDGAVIYINGTEVARSNMPASPAAITYLTPASTAVGGTDETTYFNIALPNAPSLLVAGTNVIAVEIHQSGSSSSDLSFDMDLVAQTLNGTPSSGSLTRGPYLNQNHSDSIIVRWRSSQPITGRVRYGLSPTSLDQIANESAAATDHVVRLTGLTPYTRYYYSVGSEFDTIAGGDDTFTFRTSPAAGTATDTRIWVVGDCGRGNNNQKSARSAYYQWTGTRTPDLCLMLGDNAYDAGTDAEFQTKFFDIYPTYFRKMPLWSTIGNHEANNGGIAATSNGTVSNNGTFPYLDMFTFPTAGECGGVASGSERYFSFDYGNIHIVNLDSQTSSRSTIEMNGSDGAMAAWLRADLASTTKTWIIAIFHHPPYSKGSHNSDTEQQMVQMRTNFGPILEAGGVDLVLVGHSHSYERSKFIDGHYGLSTTFNATAHVVQTGNGRPGSDGAYIKPLTGPRDHFGAVYTVTGSAGGTSGGSLNHPAMYLSFNTLGTFNLDINGNTLNATYIEPNAVTSEGAASIGVVTDTFTIIKQGAADSDGDGIPDEYEIAHGLDRFSSADATLDGDGDGVNNRDEFVLGLNAKTPDRYQWSATRDPQSGEITVSYSTITGRTYRVWYSDDLATWNPGSDSVPGTGSTLTWTDDGTTTGTPPSDRNKRFYQIRVTSAS